MGSGAYSPAITTKPIKRRACNRAGLGRRLCAWNEECLQAGSSIAGLGSASERLSCSARQCSQETMRSSIRAISTGWLHALPHFHSRPINVVVFHGSQTRPGFEGSFPLRCLQRLSRPHIATRRCGWRHNRYTRGASIPVLSY